MHPLHVRELPLRNPPQHRKLTEGLRVSDEALFTENESAYASGAVLVALTVDTVVD